jgi:hypothetical protein
MAEERQPPRRRPGTPRTVPDHLTPERILALAAVAGLLLVGLISLILIAGATGGDDEDQVAAAPTATATPKPTATPKRVLVGRTTSGSHLAFFFVNGDYIGNDAPDPSAKLKVARLGDLTVTLAYGIYAPGDAQDKPTGGPVKVRFKWDGTRLAPQDPLPPPDQRTPGRQGT